MQVNPTSQATSSTASTPQQQLDGQTFMTLLVAQLKAQDPLSPMDPTQMVTQLVQVNTLSQITQMREDIEKQINSAAATTPATPLPTSNPST